MPNSKREEGSKTKRSSKTKTEVVPAEKPEGLYLIEVAEAQAAKARGSVEAHLEARDLSANLPRRQYQRQKLKKQFTVRIDEELSKVVLAKAQAEGLRLTDAVEQGLWLWAQQRRGKEMVLRGRFLWNVIPLEMQKLTLHLWEFFNWGEYKPVEEIFRKAMKDFLWTAGQDPRSQVAREKLGELPGRDAED